MTTLGPDECGGCQGLGNHRRLCPHHPDYHPWRRLAQMAEDIGDTIGSNDPGLANRAYDLASRISAVVRDRVDERHAREARIADLEAITEETRRLENLEGL